MIKAPVRSFDLPSQVIGLKDKIITFKNANRKGKPNTEWFEKCVDSIAFQRFNKSEFLSSRLNEIEFAELTARAYLELLQRKDLPYFIPTAVKQVSEQARKLRNCLSNSNLLPNNADNFGFLKELENISTWDYRKPLPNQVTIKGNPVTRFLIYQLSEEFSFSFARKPTVLIIADLVRIGWPKIDDRTIRYTADDKLFEFALNQATIRRDKDNQSKTITQQINNSEHQAQKIITSLKQQNQNHSVIANVNDWTLTDDISRLKAIEKIAKGLTDPADRRRLISIANSILNEHEYKDED